MSKSKKHWFIKALKTILKYIGVLLLLPIFYVLISLLLSVITIERENKDSKKDKIIYLTTNGVHLDIVIPKNNLSPSLSKGLQQNKSFQYLAFGWGDKNFYLNTPTWSDLTVLNALHAIFLEGPALIHVTRYNTKQSKWIEIEISQKDLDAMNKYISNYFQTHANGDKLLLKNKGYTSYDNFYMAKGSYSCFKTCNSWVNQAFKESKLKACLWTPFDFALINKYD